MQNAPLRMARRTILTVAAALLVILGAAHVWLHPARNAVQDDTLERLEALHQTLAEKTAHQEREIAALHASSITNRDAARAEANPTSSAVAAAVATRLRAMRKEADAHAEAHEAHHEEIKPYRLEKHTSHVPFVFVAGLEGTGHHWFKAFWEACGAKARPSLIGPLAWQRAAAVFNARMGFDFHAARLAAEAARAEVDSPSNVYVLNTLGGRNDEALRLLKAASPGSTLPWGEGEGMGSYPNWWGSPTPDHKALQMPDVVYMAEALAGLQNAQLRVVLLTREAQAIVRSVCDKRNFAKSVGGCAAEVQILALGAGALSAQIEALPPPPRVVCEHVRFGELQSGEAFARLGVLANIDDAIRIAKRVRASASPPGGAGPKTERAKRDRAQLVAVLARAQGAAVGACARQGLRKD